MTQAQPDDDLLPTSQAPARQEAEPVDAERLPAKAYADMTRAEAIAAFLPEILGRHAAGETISAIAITRIVVNPDDGTESLVRRDRNTFPVRETFYRWCAEVPEVAQQFAHARALWREAIADQMVAIADDGSRDWVLTERAGWILDSEHVQRSKLRIHAREQLLARARIGGMLADDAASKGQPKTLPPRIEVVGIEPKRSPMPAPGAPIEGQAVRVQPDGEDD